MALQLAQAALPTPPLGALQAQQVGQVHSRLLRAAIPVKVPVVHLWMAQRLQSKDFRRLSFHLLDVKTATLLLVLLMAPVASLVQVVCEEGLGTEIELAFMAVLSTAATNRQRQEHRREIALPALCGP